MQLFLQGDLVHPLDMLEPYLTFTYKTLYLSPWGDGILQKWPPWVLLDWAPDTSSTVTSLYPRYPPTLLSPPHLSFPLRTITIATPPDIPPALLPPLYLPAL